MHAVIRGSVQRKQSQLPRAMWLNTGVSWVPVPPSWGFAISGDAWRRQVQHPCFWGYMDSIPRVVTGIIRALDLDEIWIMPIEEVPGRRPSLSRLT